MVVQVKTQHGGGGVCGNVEPVHVDRVNGKQVAVGAVTGGRVGPIIAADTGVAPQGDGFIKPQQRLVGQARAGGKFRDSYGNVECSPVPEPAGGGGVGVEHGHSNGFGTLRQARPGQLGGHICRGNIRVGDGVAASEVGGGEGEVRQVPQGRVGVGAGESGV